MTFEHFHSLGNVPELIEQLKIADIESAILGRNNRKVICMADILSKPVALDLQCLDKRVPTTNGLVVFSRKLSLVVV